MHRITRTGTALVAAAAINLASPMAYASPLDQLFDTPSDPQATAMVQLPTTPAPTTTADGRQVTINDGIFTSTDGKNTPIYWKSNTIANPKGTVVVVHGAAEHLGRYEWVTGNLLNAGYNVYRLDHRGHGKSGRVENTPVAKGHIDDFHYLVDDLNQLVKKAKAEHPDNKTFLLGHSMGGLAVNFYGIKYPGVVDGIIANGGGAAINPHGGLEKSTVLTPAQLTDMQREAQPTLYESLPWQQMTTFNSRLVSQLPNRKDMRVPSLPGTERIQVGNPLAPKTASSQRVRDEYKTDQLNNSTMSIGMAQQMVVAGFYNGINADSFTDPTLIMHGTADEIVPPFFSQDWYNGISSTDKKFVEWKGQFHEVFNEPAQKEAIDFAIAWLNERV